MESPTPGAKLLLTAEETAQALSLSRSKVYDLIGKGDLPSVKIHGSRRVPVDQLTAWIEQHYEVQSAAHGGLSWS